MQWLILSLLTALAVSTQDAWMKKFFSHCTPFEMVSYPALFSWPLFAVATAFAPRPPLDAVFIWCLLASIPLNGTGFILYMQAIKISPLSLTLPYLAFTPVFMILTGAVLLGEVPNLWGGAGILFTCAGGYILNLDPGRWQALAPLRAVFRETGSWLMLIVAFVFSFAAVVGKLGILHSSPFYFTMSFFSIFNLVLLIGLFLLGKIAVGMFRRQAPAGAVAGGLLFLHAIFHGFAIALTKAAYMIAIKRLSILFGVAYGALLFKEKNIPIRLGGSLMMVGGAALIVLKG